MGISGVLCVVHPASSRSAWYALPTLMWWIQGVTPATLAAVGLVRTTVCGPFQCGAKESSFQCLTTPDPRHTFVNLFPKGEWHPFLYKLSYLIYTLPSCSVCCEISSPLTWGKFIMGGGFPYTILSGEEPWDGGVILSLSRADGNKPAQEQSVSKIHLSLFKCPVGSFHHPRLYAGAIGPTILGPICCM